jgi:hypothetical protein
MQAAKKGFLSGCFGCFGVGVAVVLVLIVGGVIVGALVSNSGGGGDEPKVVSGPTADEQHAPSGGGTQAQPIGTTQKLGDAEVTVHGVRGTSGDELFQPDPGNKYVIVDVSAKNVGDNPYNLSSILQCGMRDSSGRNYTITIGPDTTGSFDGTMQVGATIRGEVAFEVPTSATGLTFIFEQALGTGQAFWAVQ